MKKFTFILMSCTFLSGVSVADELFDKDIQIEQIYELKELSDVDPENLPADTITKYELKEVTKFYDKKTGQEVAAENKVSGVEYEEIKVKEAVPHYYSVDINKAYGDTESAEQIYYKWGENKYNQPVLQAGTADDYDLKFGINSTLPKADEKLVYDGTEKIDVSSNFDRFSGVNEPSAFVNTGSMGTVSGDFVNNTDKGNPNKDKVGTLYNSGTVDTIKANFTNNTFNQSVYANTIVGGSGIYNAETGHIRKIEGTFINNTISGYGILSGAISNYGDIDFISGTFIGNSVAGSVSEGSAIYNHGGYIGTISGNFIGNTNYGTSQWRADGGAIWSGIEHLPSGQVPSIDAIYGNFIGNETNGYGGAIFIRDGSVGEIEGNFIGNRAGGTGAVFSWGKIGTIKGNFINNSAERATGALSASASVIEANFIGNHAGTHSGAFVNEGGNIKLIKGDFIGNYVKNETSAVTDAVNYQHQSWGGAITYDRCGGGKLLEISGNFIGNYIESVNSEVSGGAVSNFYDEGGVMGVIHNGDFIGNYVYSEKNIARGGAYVGRAEALIDKLHTNFYYNYAKSDGKDVFGGAVANEDSVIGEISGNFVGNYALTRGGSAYGGAIYNNGTVGAAEQVADGVKGILNTSFYGNYARAANGKAYGGAIYSEDGRVQVTADAGQSVFAGNYVEDIDGKRNEAMYANGGELNLTAVNGGVIDFEDDINGADYDITLSGDESGEIVFNGKVSGASAFNAGSGAVYHLGKNAVVDTVNYTADNATLKLDMTVDADSETIQNGIINVSGDVVGNTKVIVNAENPATFEEAKTMFVNAANYEGGTAEQFEVSRVIGSPYMWQSVVNAGGEESGSYWYLSLTDERNPDFTFAPEVAAYAGLQSAAVEQNRRIGGSVVRGLAYKKSLNCYEESCGVAEIMPQKQAWIDVSYENAEIDSPADMDAKISGSTFGLDLYRDANQRAGVFAVYRYGKYDLSGKGKYYSATESDITNKSYLGGAYYQYDNDDVRLTGTVFAGKQDMDIKTADGIVKAGTEAMQYGASAEAAKRYTISERLSLEPSLGLYYSLIDVDDLEDNVGKRAAFDTMHYLEAELGAKLAYVFCREGCTNRVYAKPSVIRTFTSGGKTRISGLDDVKSYEDKTLGRMEFGGEFGLNDRWTGWAAAGYTFGDDYKAYDVNIGVGYRF